MAGQAIPPQTPATFFDSLAAHPHNFGFCQNTVGVQLFLQLFLSRCWLSGAWPIITEGEGRVDGSALRVLVVPREKGKWTCPKKSCKAAGGACLPQEQCGALSRSFGLLALSPARQGVGKSEQSQLVSQGIMGLVFGVRCA